MPPKAKPEINPDVEPFVDDVEGDEFVAADEMATALETLAELDERVSALERRAEMSAAAAAPMVPTFRGAAGARRPRRESEGERQDRITRENARRHMHEPAGDGVPTQPVTPGARVPESTDEPGEGGMEDAASPAFESHGGESQVGITTHDVEALNPPRRA